MPAWEWISPSVRLSSALQNVSFSQTKPILGTALIDMGQGSTLYFYSSSELGNTYIANRVTRDGGMSWSQERKVLALSDSKAMAPSVLKTRDGVLHLFFIGYKKHEWRNGEPTPNDRSDLWTSRSFDHGITWSKPNLIYRGYTGSTNGAIETQSGTIIVPFSHYVSSPGRLVARVAVSKNGGEEWFFGAFVDIGGAGDHDGAMEPTVAEIASKQILMLIRTRRGYLWQALSNNLGETWSKISPTRISSAEAPANMLKTTDDRFFVVWNPRQDSMSELLDSDVNNHAIERMLAGRKELRLSEFFLDDQQNIRLGTELFVAQGAHVTYPTIVQQDGDFWLAFQDVSLGWRQVKVVIAKIDHYRCALR